MKCKDEIELRIFAFPRDFTFQLISQCAMSGSGNFAKIPHRYFLNVPAVTATLNANSVANGRITKLGCTLNGKAK